MFKDLKDFDAQNPVIGSLIREVDIGKKKDLSKILDKATDIRDLELRSGLNKLRDGREFFNRGDNTEIIIIMVEMFFCCLLHLCLVLIFQTKQGSDRFQTLEVF